MKDVTEAQWALALEVFGTDANVRYMLCGAGLRQEMTLKLLDALREERQAHEQTRADLL